MIRTTLSQFYGRVNPNRNPEIDRRELRADSDTATLRVKTREACIPCIGTRALHQDFARIQLKAMLENSIRERFPEAEADQVQRCQTSLWFSVHDGSPEIRVRQVRQLQEAVSALPPPDQFFDQFIVLPNAVRIDTRPYEAAPALAASPLARSPEPTRESTPAPFIVPAPPAPAPAVSAAALPRTPALRAPAPRRPEPVPSTGVQDVRARLAHKNDKIEAFSQLKKALTPAELSHLSTAQRIHFEYRLRHLVACAAKYLPELMRGRADDKAVLAAAARHILGSKGLLLDSRAALYKALVVCDVGAAQRLFRALPQIEAAALSRNLHTD